MPYIKPTSFLAVALLFAAACTTGSPAPLPTPAATTAPAVPELPFADNPDPALCGIPQPWNSDTPAYLSGLYQGELIQPIVYLYDSHLRREVVGQAPHGSEVQIVLSQSNPTLDYFFVKVVGAPVPVEGWVPAPFIAFQPPDS
ncbi:MAG: hypothetical protein Kow0031_12910 [Anaerolineae bacterium]